MENDTFQNIPFQGFFLLILMSGTYFRNIAHRLRDTLYNVYYHSSSFPYQRIRQCSSIIWASTVVRKDIVLDLDDEERKEAVPRHLVPDLGPRRGQPPRLTFWVTDPPPPTPHQKPNNTTHFRLLC